MNYTVYLIHFDRKISHAGHYLGYTANLQERIKLHKSGNGARLLRECKRLQIPFHVVRTWKFKNHDSAKSFEDKLKARKESPRLCPVCNPKNYQNRANSF